MIKTRLSAGSNTLQRTFSGSNVTSSVSTSPKSKGKDTGINASFLPSASTGGPVSTSYFGGPGYSTLLQGIVPDKNPMAMIPYYRDCYYTDGIAGATVDMSSTFPFSDFSLTGLQSGELDVYNDSLSRLNMRSLMSEISAAYLVDGAFIGTLVFDPASRSFQDVLVHDTANAQISMQPLHSLDPVIKVNSANALNQFLGSDSPYIDSMLSSYPKSIIETYLEGNVALDPLSTLFVPRRGLQDSTHTSYLHRVMPSYLFEKVMYRGTLIEAHKRQRSTTHIKMGDENWIPSDEEIAMTLGEFQRTEMDPLGAWIATRQGIDISEVRSPSDSFKWTEIVDTMVPIKLRALGVSEAFLSGDACLSGDTLVSVCNEHGELLQPVSIKSIGPEEFEHNKFYPVDTVYSISRYGVGKVVRWACNGERITYTVTHSLGSIRATDNHKVLVFDGLRHAWTRVDELKAGVHYLCEKLEATCAYRYSQVLGIEEFGKELVYDLTMEEGTEPAFVANGLVVHNSYSTAESAVNSFTDSMLSFRQFLTYKIFQSRIFPLIAVLHNLYKDKNKSFSGDASIGTIYKNLGNINNLKLPTIQWHKSLEGKDSESQFDMLERLSEKGFVIPLRMWASSAGLDMSALMRDLAEDAQIKAEMEKMTGKRAETIGNEDKKGFDDNAFLAEGESEEAGGAPPEGELGAALLARKKFLASKLRPSSVSTRVPILARDMTHLDLPRNARLSKSGKNLHANVGDHRQDRIANDKIIKAIRALKDPEHAKKVRDSRLQARASGVRLIPGGMV